MEVTHVETEHPDEPENEPSTQHELGEHDASIEHLNQRVEELQEQIATTTELITDHSTNHPEPVAAVIDPIDHSIFVTKEELATTLAATLPPPIEEVITDEPPPPDEPPESRQDRGFGARIRDWFYK